MSGMDQVCNDFLRSETWLFEITMKLCVFFLFSMLFLEYSAAKCRKSVNNEFITKTVVRSKKGLEILI